MKFAPLFVGALALLAPTATAFAPSSLWTSTNARSTTELFAGVERNENFAKLTGGYLFPEIGRRRNAYLEANPEMNGKIISLGIGDTTLPVPPHILNGLLEGVKKLGNKETYTGVLCVSACGKRTFDGCCSSLIVDLFVLQGMEPNKA